MKRMLRAVEVLAWATFFAFAVLVLALRFWLLPNIERYRDDIVAAVTRTVGQPVKIARIEAGWLGMNPQVTLYDVRILDAQGREALVLPVVENAIGWRSLVFGELRLHGLAIDGPRLRVRRDAAGDIYVAGMKVSGAARPGVGRSDAVFVDWLLAQPEIEVRNAEIEWHDEKRNAPPLALSALNFRLRNNPWEHSAGLSARVPPELGSTIEVRAELAGRSLAPGASWRGRVYAETGYTDLAGWRPWIDYPVQLGRGNGAARVWVTIEDGELAEVTADLLVADFAPAAKPLEFRIAWSTERGGRGSFAAKDLQLEALSHVADALPLDAALRRRIDAAAPRGRLQDVKVTWAGPLAAPAQIAGRTRFTGLSVQSDGQLPGVAGLSGTLEASESRGSLSLDAKGGELVLPGIFPDPRLAFDTLAGQLSWENRGSAGWTLRIASLALANPDLDGRASGSYDNPGFGPGAIDLTAELRRADGRRTERYLPSGEIMGPATRRYLAAAIKEGQASEVKLRMRGELRDFPFTDPAKGEFQVTTRVERGVFQPGESWPSVKDVEAQLLFERNRMEITGRSAAILGTRVENLRIAIPDIGLPQPQLVVTGQAEGTLSEFLKYVAASPVRGMTGGLMDGMAGSGRGRLGVKMEMPLGDPDKTRIAGDFRFSASSFTAHPRLPPIERAAGAVAFTESSLQMTEGRGRLFGGGLSVSGGSKPDGGVEFVARGEASVAALQALTEHPVKRHFSGAAPYTATLQLKEGRGRVSIESNLRGVASTLPPPLAKSAPDALPLRVELVPAEAGRDRMSVHLGSLLHAELLRRAEGDAMQVQRAAVWFAPQAGQQVRLPERPGVLVYGPLARLDADRWLAALETPAAETRPAPDSTTAPPGGAGMALPVSLDVRIGELDLYGKRFHSLALRAAVDPAGWSATVQSAELAGELTYRKEKGGQLVARLASLSIATDVPGAGAGRRDGRLSELPAIDLVAERFTLNEKQLGRVEIVAEPEAPNWRIHKLAIANPDGALSGKGLWRTGPAQYTALNVELDAADGGKLLARLGYPDVVRGSRARMQASLTWSGDPVSIDYPSLSGDLQLQADDGQFLEIDPGVGKLLSVMSLQALPRRLSLDFRDVFSKGFQFDRVRASAQVEKGVMTLKDFGMRGSAAEVEMGGQVDLARETQALNVRVIPQLGDTASTALLFVNPFLYFPAALAQRILKDPLGHIFAFNYAVSGSWADPKIERTGVNARPVDDPANKQ